MATTFKDEVLTHEDTGTLSALAWAIWSKGTIWCNQQETDGAIPRRRVRAQFAELLPGVPISNEQLDSAIGELLETRLWEEVEPGRYVYRNWAKHNQTRAQREARREAERLRWQTRSRPAVDVPDPAAPPLRSRAGADAEPPRSHGGAAPAPEPLRVGSAAPPPPLQNPSPSPSPFHSSPRSGDSSREVLPRLERRGEPQGPSSGAGSSVDHLDENGERILEALAKSENLRGLGARVAARAQRYVAGIAGGRLKLEDVLHALAEADRKQGDNLAGGAQPPMPHELAKFVLGCVNRAQLGDAQRARERERGPTHSPATKLHREATPDARTTQWERIRSGLVSLASNQANGKSARPFEVQAFHAARAWVPESPEEAERVGRLLAGIDPAMVPALPEPSQAEAPGGPVKAVGSPSATTLANGSPNAAGAPNPLDGGGISMAGGAA